MSVQAGLSLLLQGLRSRSQDDGRCDLPGDGLLDLEAHKETLVVSPSSLTLALDVFVKNSLVEGRFIVDLHRISRGVQGVVLVEC